MRCFGNITQSLVLWKFTGSPTEKFAQPSSSCKSRSRNEYVLCPVNVTELNSFDHKRDAARGGGALRPPKEAAQSNRSAELLSAARAARASTAIAQHSAPRDLSPRTPQLLKGGAGTRQPLRSRCHPNIETAPSRLCNCEPPPGQGAAPTAVEPPTRRKCL